MRFRILLVVPAVCLCIAWYAHVVHTELGDPLGLPFDTSLWRVSCLLKLATHCSITALLSLAARNLRTRPHLAAMTIFRWGLICFLSVAIATLTRSIWAPILWTQTTKFYVAAGPPPPGMATSWANWQWAWSRGITLAVESGVLFTIGICCTQLTISYSKSTVVTVLACYAIAMTSAALFAILTGWAVIDYDLFHGDVFLSSVALDHLSPWTATDPTTSVSAIAYLLLSAFLYRTAFDRVSSEEPVDYSVQEGNSLRTDSNPYSPPRTAANGVITMICTGAGSAGLAQTTCDGLSPFYRNASSARLLPAR